MRDTWTMTGGAKNSVIQRGTRHVKKTLDDPSQVHMLLVDIYSHSCRFIHIDLSNRGANRMEGEVHRWVSRTHQHWHDQCLKLA